MLPFILSVSKDSMLYLSTAARPGCTELYDVWHKSLKNNKAFILKRIK